MDDPARRDKRRGGIGGNGGNVRGTRKRVTPFAAVDLHAILVRRGVFIIDQVLLPMTINFRSVTYPRLTRFVLTVAIRIFQQIRGICPRSEEKQGDGEVSERAGRGG